MTGGRASRERATAPSAPSCVCFRTRGFAAERVPLSGAARGRFGGDVSVPLLGVDRRVEVKCRCDGFRELYKWLANADLLIVKCDRGKPLVVIPFELAVEIAECRSVEGMTIKIIGADVRLAEKRGAKS